MGTIRQILNQNLLVSVGLVLYVAADTGFEIIKNYTFLKSIGIWLIVMGAGLAIYNRFTRPDSS